MHESTRWSSQIAKSEGMAVGGRKLTPTLWAPFEEAPEFFHKKLAGRQFFHQGQGGREEVPSSEGSPKKGPNPLSPTSVLISFENVFGDVIEEKKEDEDSSGKAGKGREKGEVHQL